MVRKIVLSLIAVLGICAVAMAQNQQVSGTVTDAAGAPVAGATVMVDGTTVGTTTSADGAYSISVPMASVFASPVSITSTCWPVVVFSSLRGNILCFHT